MRVSRLLLAWNAPQKADAHDGEMKGRLSRASERAFGEFVQLISGVVKEATEILELVG